MVRVDADLLDMGGPVNNVEQQIRHRSVVGAQSDQRTAALSVRGQLFDGARIIVGDDVHAARSSARAARITGGNEPPVLCDIPEYWPRRRFCIGRLTGSF